MKPSPAPPDPWSRLAAAARSAPASPDLDDARAVSARAVHRWLHPPVSSRPAATAPDLTSALWERWTFRGLAVAGAVTLAALALNLNALAEDLDPGVLSLDPVSGLLASL